MILYHGSEKIIRHPVYGGGRRGNDFGSAFYCTEVPELAEEWAAVSLRGGFVNVYNVDFQGLRCMDLRFSGNNTNSDISYFEEYEQQILLWMALLVNYRNLRISNPVERRGKEYLIRNYLPDMTDVDAVIAWKADDSFFTFARAFLSNTITVQQLTKALFLGDLGIQYAIRSRAAFERITFIEARPVDGSIFYPRRSLRDQRAREAYRKLLETEDTEGMYLSELIRR